VRETEYVLEHRQGIRPGGRILAAEPRWYRSQKLGSGLREAKAELERKRALAVANDAAMEYRVVKETREVLAW
jgi:hypothetical protein